MANFNGDIKKLKRGELCGTISTAFCGAVFVFFVIGISVSSVKDMKDFRLITIILSAVLMAVSAAIAAFCNVKFGGAIEKAIKKYIVDVFVENAEALHPERNSLSFYLSLKDGVVELTANGYKEKVVFDFAEREGMRKKTGKIDFIIKNGQPDKKAYKVYLKNKDK